MVSGYKSYFQNTRPLSAPMLNLWKANINCGCNVCFYHEFRNWTETRFYFFWQKHVIIKIYRNGSGNIWSCLYNWWHESLLPAFVIILIILFLNFKNAAIKVRIAPKDNAIRHEWLYISLINHFHCIQGHNGFIALIA